MHYQQAQQGLKGDAATQRCCELHYSICAAVVTDKTLCILCSQKVVTVITAYTVT
jgi:hypothetical protein